MKKLISKLETLLVSVTFAEAGEHEISKQVLAEDVITSQDAEPCLSN